MNEKKTVLTKLWQFLNKMDVGFTFSNVKNVFVLIHCFLLFLLFVVFSLTSSGLPLPEDCDCTLDDVQFICFMMNTSSKDR